MSHHVLQAADMVKDLVDQFPQPKVRGAKKKKEGKDKERMNAKCRIINKDYRTYVHIDGQDAASLIGDSGQFLAEGGPVLGTVKSLPHYRLVWRNHCSHHLFDGRSKAVV